MAKSKRQQQSKRIGQSQPEGVTRAASSNKTASTGATATKKASPVNPDVSPPRLSGIRERSQAPQRRPKQSSRYAQQPWWRRNLGALITVAVIVMLIGAFVAFAKFQNNQAAVGIGSPVPSSVMKDLTTVPATTFAKVGEGSAANSVKTQWQAAPAGTPPLTSKGKPEVIYVGAEYCPYCAAERWGTVVALSRFGTFKGLELMRSASNDSFPNTPTLSFQNATYTSQYIVFNATETEDRNKAPLATPPADVMTIFSTYDNGGSIPFMSYGNQYVSVGGPFLPTMMANLDWQQVSSQLKDPNSDVAKAVIGSANYQTAAICKLTNNQPGNVCNTPVIQQIEAKLPVAK